MALNAAQERFCANLIAGMKAKEAYLDAFPDANPATAAVRATQEKKKPEIQARLKNIQTEVRAETNITVHKIAEELEDARQVARAEKSPNLMMKASMLKAQVLGLITDDQGLGAGLSVGSLKLEISKLQGLKNELDDNE